MYCFVFVTLHVESCEENRGGGELVANQACSIRETEECGEKEGGEVLLPRKRLSCTSGMIVMNGIWIG